MLVRTTVPACDSHRGTHTRKVSDVYRRSSGCVQGRALINTDFPHYTSNWRRCSGSIQSLRERLLGGKTPDLNGHVMSAYYRRGPTLMTTDTPSAASRVPRASRVTTVDADLLRENRSISTTRRKHVGRNR